MKKIVLFVAVIALVVSSAVAKPKVKPVEGTPVCDAADAVSFDGQDYGYETKENFRFVNHTNDSGLLFNVWVYNEKTGVWTQMGSAWLKGNGETYLSFEKGMKVKNYRYFAIEAFGYRTDKFSYKLTQEGDDICVYVTKNR